MMTRLNKRVLCAYLLMGGIFCQNLLRPDCLVAADMGNSGASAGIVDRVTVTFYGDASRGRGFTWYTGAASTGSQVQIVEKTEEGPRFDAAAVFHGACSLSAHSLDFPKEMVHKAEAVGLKPGTSYYYRAGDAGLGLWSDTGVFHTAPAAGAFTFIDLADTQCADERECSLSAETIAKAFAVSPGAGLLAINWDIVDNGDKERQWKWLLDYAEKSVKNTTLLPIAGNHDQMKNAFIEHFNVKPPSGATVKSGAYYSVDYGNAHFIALNSNEKSGNYANFSPAQARWLKEDAAQAKARGAEWLIALIHEGPYTTGPHATDPDIAGPGGSRRMVAPLLAKAGVDLVLQGHDHVYARSKPIAADGAPVKAGRGTEILNGKEADYMVDPGAPVYLIPGAAGRKVYYRNKNAPPGYYDLFDSAEETRAAVHGSDSGSSKNPAQGLVQNFTVITINGSRLTAVSYEIDQTRGDARPYIIDQFGIVKKSPVTAPLK